MQKIPGLVAASVVAIVFMPAALALSDRTSITGRLEITKKDSCLFAQIYLKNTLKEDLKIITGSGGVDDDREVLFLCNGEKCPGARWSSISYRRDMRPVYRLLPPSKEVLYGKFLLPIPEARGRGFEGISGSDPQRIETTLDLYSGDVRDKLYQVELKSTF